MGSKPLCNSPRRKRNAKLSPTDRAIFSHQPNRFNLKIQRRRKPGIKVNKTKLEIVRRKGILKKTETAVVIIRTTIITIN